MQATDGHIINVVGVGDVFRVRHCFFRVETIGTAGISAREISRRDYLKQKHRMRRDYFEQMRRMRGTLEQTSRTPETPQIDPGAGACG